MSAKKHLFVRKTLCIGSVYSLFKLI